MTRFQTLILRLFHLSFRVLQRVSALAQALLKGFWLGILSRPTLHLVDQSYYDREPMYQNDAYNKRGFWFWEEKMIAEHFGGRQKLLVTGAGGGREVLALRRAGFEAWGQEVHPQFTAFAVDLLRREGFTAEKPLVVQVPRDECPSDGSQYEGAILGWGSYMLIAGRNSRVAFLRQVRAQLPVASPLLLSFFSRQGNTLYYRTIAATGNVWRVLLWRERLDVGDDFSPNFVHFFDEAQIASELREAGFELRFYHAQEKKLNDYGHAVAVACD